MKNVTEVEIDSSAIKSNIELFHKLIGENRKIMAVVKSNGYGHGAYETATAAFQAGASFAGVYSLEEGLSLRAKGFTGKIFLMGFVLPENIVTVAENNFSIGVVSKEQLTAFIEKLDGRSLNAHFKFDTGLRRLGFLPDEISWLLETLEQHPEIKPEGLYTHFADIEDTTSHEFARSQRELFIQMCAPFMGKYNPLRHCACSAASLLFPETHLEMVRVGISMYGMWPSKETLITALIRRNGNISLKPALTWKTHIAQVKKIVPGDTVGYGRTHHVTREGKMAILPIGYADGYFRALSNRSLVLIRGMEAPVIGRICMNMCMVDVSHIKDAAMGDEVVLIGRQGDKEITADHLAELCGTINYEITSTINPLIPRVVK